MTDLKIYWSNLTPTRNGWVDEIESYLDGLQVYYHCANFQYQRFENELEIVIPVSQADLSNQEVGNYVRFYQDNVAWYYFVMSYKWTSKTSLRLSLSIDSVNTFVGTHVHFSPKTVIEREHEDRYAGSNSATKLIKRFDPENEEIPITQERTTNTVVTQSNKSNINWYLIYDSEISSADENKPVRCRLLADQAILVYKSSGTTPAQQWRGNDISNDDYYYMDGIDNDFIQLGMRLPYRISNSDTWADRNLELGTQIIIDGPSRLVPVPGGAQTFYYSYWRGTINGFRIIGVNGQNVNVAISVKDVVSGEQPGVRPNGVHWPGTYTTAPDWLTGGVNHDFEYIWVKQLTSYRYSSANNITIPYSSYIIPEANKVSVQIGSTVTRTTIPFEDMDRTDSRLIKIIDLPYAPCEITYDAQTGVYTFPNEWEYESGYMRLKDEYFNKGFESSLDDVNWNFFVQDIPSEPKVQDNRLTKDDPKLATSQFSTYKFLYDSFAQEVKLEKFVLANGQTQIALPIKFKPTNTINSRFAFKLDWNSTSWGSISTIKVSGDYDEYLLANRNNEETIFSSDYLNYLRNGYNYDKKIKSEQSAMSYLMGGLQVAGAVVGFAASAFTGGASAAAGVALATGAITTFASAGYQQYSNEQAMAQKIKNLQMQAANVSGSDDVNLLKYYSQNKLYFVVYEPLQFQKDALNNLFYYCGYKHKKMGIPNTTSRTWFNFIQCKPVFEEEENSQPGAPYNKFWDDIKTRFMAGVTRYHRVNEAYDWSQEKENWETFLTAPAFDINDMSAVKWSSKEFPSYVRRTTFTGTWNGPTLNNKTQYIKVNFYDTEADWDDEEPNDSAIVTVSADKSFTTFYVHQGLYVVTFQVVNTVNPQKSSGIRKYFNVY